MSSILIAAENFHTRQQELESIFGPLAGRPRARSFWKSNGLDFLLGLGSWPSDDNLSSARHQSRIDDVYLNYYEIWQPISPRQPKKYRLEKAYLHVIAASAGGAKEEELLALHCDPTLAPSEPSYNYRSGPHFHFASTKRRLKKAHIALCLTSLPYACSSLDGFASSWRQVIKMVDEEIFPNLIDVT